MSWKLRNSLIKMWTCYDEIWSPTKCFQESALSRFSLTMVETENNFFPTTWEGFRIPLYHKKKKKFKKIQFKFKNIRDTNAGCLVEVIDSQLTLTLTLFHTLEFKLAKLKSKSIASFFFCEKFCSFFNNFFQIYFPFLREKEGRNMTKRFRTRWP